MEKKIKYKENCLEPEDYFELRRSVNWRVFGEQQTGRALDNSIYDIVAYEGIKPVGMGRLVGDGALYYYIQDVIVRPDYQGRGIGTEIINRLTAFVDEATAQDERASIGLISEKDKEGFYKQFGFKTLPTNLCGAGMRKIVYKLEE